MMRSIDAKTLLSRIEGRTPNLPDGYYIDPLNNPTRKKRWIILSCDNDGFCRAFRMEDNYTNVRILTAMAWAHHHAKLAWASDDAGRAGLSVINDDVNANEYQELAMRTANRLARTHWRLMNSALGVCGEAGEVADIVKKHVFHERPLDSDRLILELGDVLWYLAQACDALGVSLGEVMARNVQKLRERWPDGFKPGSVEAGGDTAISEEQPVESQDEMDSPGAWV